MRAAMSSDEQRAGRAIGRCARARRPARPCVALAGELCRGGHVRLRVLQREQAVWLGAARLNGLEKVERRVGSEGEHRRARVDDRRAWRRRRALGARGLATHAHALERHAPHVLADGLEVDVRAAHVEGLHNFESAADAVSGGGRIAEADGEA